MPEETAVEEEKKRETAEKAPKESPAENPEESPESINMQTSQMAVLFSPAGILMLGLAITLDIFGLIEFIPVLGSALSYIPDIIGIIMIGGWTYFNSGTLKVTRGAAAGIGKAAQWAKRLKWLRPLLFLLEFIPVVGMLPCWTLVVWFELKR
ncbi:hypothetical protein ACFL11_01360 [Patescibacteria group bacterium]